MIIRNLKWAEIIEDDSQAVMNSAMYFIGSSDTTFRIILVDDSGDKRNLYIGGGSTTPANIDLNGDIYGSGTSSISTYLTPNSITLKPNADINSNGGLNSNAYFLVNQDGTLRKYEWNNLQNFIISVAGGSSSSILSFETDIIGSVNPSITTTLIDTNANYTSTYNIEGTLNEVEVEGDPVNKKIKIGLPDNVNITNDLIVGGNFYVNGTLTYLDTQELKVEDNIITVNAKTTGTPVLNGGIEVERGNLNNTSVIFNETTDRWTFTNDGTNFYNIPIPSEYPSYSHPTQTAITQTGTGLEFIQSILVNTLGHVTSVTKGTVPTASQTIKGVVELAEAAQLIPGNNSTVTTPSDVYTIVNQIQGSNKLVTTITGTSNITHNFNTEDIIVQAMDTVTKESVFPDVVFTNLNTLQVKVATGYPNSIKVKLLKM